MVLRAPACRALGRGTVGIQGGGIDDAMGHGDGKGEEGEEGEEGARPLHVARRRQDSQRQPAPARANGRCTRYHALVCWICWARGGAQWALPGPAGAQHAAAASLLAAAGAAVAPAGSLAGSMRARRLYRVLAPSISQGVRRSLRLDRRLVVAGLPTHACESAQRSATRDGRDGP